MKYMINNIHMIIRPLYSLFFKITCMHPTATTGLKNSTKQFDFRAVITGVGEAAPFPFVVALVVAADSFSSNPALSVPSVVVPLLTVSLVCFSLLWSTSFRMNMIYRHPRTFMGMQSRSNSERFYNRKYVVYSQN